MLQGFFNYDNPVWRFIGKLGDLILLNILWIVCSIPVFTIGASTTAVYYVTLKLVRDEGDSTIRSFFHSFKGNFRQATAIWMVLLAAGIVLGIVSGSLPRTDGAWERVKRCAYSGFRGHVLNLSVHRVLCISIAGQIL